MPESTLLSALGQAALDYLRRGFSVFPVTPDAKAPPLVQWAAYQERFATEAEVVAWWTQHPTANIAVATGKLSGVSVVDVDGDVGIKTFYDHLLGKMPLTLAHETPKGRHLLYKYDVRLKQGTARLPGIDVRNDGGYIIAPPSVVKGKPYRVAKHRDLAALADLPPELLGQAPVKPPALIGNPDWVTAALVNGVSESQRNDMATRLVGYFHHKDIPPDIIEATMLPFAAKCQPPMDLAELRRTIQSVHRYQAIAASQRITTPPLYRLDADRHLYTFESSFVSFHVSELVKRRGELDCWLQVTTTLPNHPANLYGPRNWSLSSTTGSENLRKALEKRIPDLDWAAMLDVVARMTLETYRQGTPAQMLYDVEDDGAEELYEVKPLITTDGLSILYGDGSTGKSMLALALSITISTGEAILGLDATRFHRVLYLDWETNARTHRRRMMKLLKGHGIDTRPEIAYLRMEAPLVEAVRQVRSEISRLGIGLAIVDSIGAAIGADLNDAENATAFANACRALGVSVLAIGHTKKNENGKTTAKPIGSNYFWNAGRNLWEAQKQQDTGDDVVNLALYHRKANDDKLYSPIGLSLMFGSDYASYTRISLEDVPDFEVKRSAHERMLTHLMTNGAGTIVQLADALDLPDSTLRKAIERDRGKTFISDGQTPAAFSIRER